MKKRVSYVLRGIKDSLKRTVTEVIIDPSKLRQVLTFATDATGGEKPKLGGFDNNVEPAGWQSTIRPAEINFWKEVAILRHVKDHVGIWEALAILMQLIMIEQQMKGKKVYLYCDNIGDVCAIAKCWSRCRVTLAIVVAIWRLIERADAQMFVKYINTEVNPADPLTRQGKMAALKENFPGMKVVGDYDTRVVKKRAMQMVNKAAQMVAAIAI